MDILRSRVGYRYNETAKTYLPVLGTVSSGTTSDGSISVSSYFRPSGLDEYTDVVNYEWGGTPAAQYIYPVPNQNLADINPLRQLRFI